MVRILRNLGLAVSLLVGGAAARADDCRLGLAATLPLTDVEASHRLLVHITANSTPLTMIVDTGAEDISLNTKAASRIAERFNTRGVEDPIGFGVGVGGARVETRMTIDNLVLGHLHGTYDNVGVSDVDFSTKDIHMDGLLGMTVLANFDLDFDLAGNELRLFRTRGACAKPMVTLDAPVYAVPLLSGYHDAVRLTVPVTVNGVAMHALFDTGAPHSLLFSHAAHIAGVAPPQGPGIKMKGVGGAVQGYVARLDTLAIGPITMRNVKVGVAEEDNLETDMLLGLDFAQKVHVWVSNSTHMLVLQYPPKPSPPLVTGN